ncbi:MAG: protein phosphatase 2C domain-containing protein [Pseudonocardia sp.]
MMFNVTYASAPTPGQPNEDYVVAGADWAVVLDGATPPTGVASGCIHGVRWLVRSLAAVLVDRLIMTDTSLPDALAAAIEATRDRHASTCDVHNPSSPSSTVAVLRLRRDRLEYLTLADSPIVVKVDDNPAHAIVDDRTAHLPSYTVEAVRDFRNTDGGFWVASTAPEAAYYAVTGDLAAKSVTGAAMLTDGAARFVDRFALSDWGGLLEVLNKSGPLELIRRVREEEAAETDEERQRDKRRGKRHDDATAVLIR